MHTLTVRRLHIAAAGPEDWPGIRRIYVQGIRSGHATFEREEDIPGASDWFAAKLPGLVFKALSPSGEMLGWSALAPVSHRRVYAGVAEVSVYVAEEVRGNGVGTHLLAHLVTASETADIWTLQASVFPENAASIRLHQRCGFRVVGVRERIGQLGGIWRDTLLLERRTSRF